MTTHSTPKKPRTGTLEAYADTSGATRYRGRLRLGDGTKSHRFDLTATTEAEARKQLAGLQAQEDATHMVLDAKRDRARELAAAAQVPHEGETCDAFFGRFQKTRAHLAQSNKDDASRWRTWIAPTIGAVPIALLTRDQVEDVRDALDRATAGGQISGKTAMAAWSVLRVLLKASVDAKDRTLRVRTVDPSAGVHPPERGKAKRKHWLFPNEVERLLSCERIPLAWRRLYAIGVYTYLRPGELLELRWKDVDLGQGELRVTRALEWQGGEVKPPKTYAGVRSVPIHPALTPLLSAMANGRPSGALVLDAPELQISRFEFARTFRAHLQTAGIDREIFDDTRTHVAINFRSLRDTGLTWSAIAGVDLVKLQRRAGHTTITMTLAYVKEAEDREHLTGSVFPPLGHLFSAPEASVVQRSGHFLPEPLKLLGNMATPTGIEPVLPT